MSNRFLLIFALSLTAWSGANGADICGNMTYEQCKQATDAALKARKNANAGQFEAVYTDNINKLSWSKALPGRYSNGCANANGEYDVSKCTFEIGADGTRQVKVEDSNAEKACPVGSRLPTKSEFESLIRNFDHTEKNYGPRLTDKGIADMQSVFGDMNNWFWSSSLGPNVPGFAFGFYGFLGVVSSFDGRDYGNAVRCVAGR